jgi:Carboxypeptidase regulatory-like domain
MERAARLRGLGRGSVVAASLGLMACAHAHPDVRIGSADVVTEACRPMTPSAEPGDAQLTVTVHDATGFALPGADVLVSWPGGEKNANAGADGVAHISVPAGPLRVRARLPGFRVVRVEDVGTRPGCATALTIPLQVESGEGCKGSKGLICM